MFIRQWLKKYMDNKTKDKEKSDEIKSIFANDLIKIEEYFYSDLDDYYSSKKVLNKGDEEANENIDNYSLNNNYILEDFEKIKLIGRGFYGKVYLVKNKKDNYFYALKKLKKSKLQQDKDLEHIANEQRTLKIVEHPFIVKLKCLFQNESNIFIITDYYSGGELFHLLRSMGTFPDNLAKFYFAQILLAIEFLHNKKIIYRDLKPENILLDSEGYLKLADFGLAKNNFEESCYTSTFCGTNEYLAPEIILGEVYSKPVDVWCLGIILYEMYFGVPPFFDSHKDKLYKKILFAEPDYFLNKISISDDTKSLISSLLDKNQKSRIKINNIRSHTYFNHFDFQSLLNKTMQPPINVSYENEIKNDISGLGSNPSTNCSEKMLTEVNKLSIES